MKRLIVVLTVLVLAASCKKQSKESSAPDAQEKSPAKITIGFSIDTLAIERWRRDCDVFLNTAKDLGADVIVQNSGNSVEVQNQQIAYLIKRGVKAVTVTELEAVCNGLCRAVYLERETVQRVLLDSIAVDLIGEMDAMKIELGSWGSASVPHCNPDLARILRGKLVETKC